MKMFKKENGIEQKVLPIPTIKCIPIADIKFAPYQRELKMSKVRKIMEYFLPDIVGIALVSFRNGTFWGIDAQHRIKALEKMGYKDIWCIVLTGLSYEEECLRFNILNTGRTQLTANQIFHSKVEGKDTFAMKLVNLFKKYRFTYNKNSAVKADNEIGAVSKFDKMQKKQGEEMVEKVLRVLRKTWFGDKESLASPIITGIGTYFSEHPDADEDILIKALEQIRPEMLVVEANAFVKCNMLRPGRADSACYHIAKRIEQLYEDEINKLSRRRKKVVNV